MRDVFIGTAEKCNHLGSRSTFDGCDGSAAWIGRGPVLRIAILAALDQVLPSSGEALMTSGVLLVAGKDRGGFESGWISAKMGVP